MSLRHSPLQPAVGHGLRQGEPDLTIERWATSQLQRSVYPTVRRTTCQYHDGVLTLIGRVPSFFHKQVAQSLLRGLREDVCIDNRLEVPAAMS